MTAQNEEKLRETRDLAYSNFDKGIPVHWRDIGPDDLWEFAWQAAIAQERIESQKREAELQERVKELETSLVRSKRESAEHSADKAVMAKEVMEQNYLAQLRQTKILEAELAKYKEAKPLWWELDGKLYKVQQRDDCGFGDYYPNQIPLYARPDNVKE